MINRDWKEIETELNGLVHGVPRDEKRLPPNYGVRQSIQADEAVLLAHIADALVQKEPF